ncbi:MAG: ornithine cyclodeaminase family protein [Mesorhizobium sp.]
MTLLLSASDIQKVLSMQDAIHANDIGFREHALGNVIMPQRLAMHLEQAEGVMLTMAACVGGEAGGAGVKHVSVFPRNAAAGVLPTTLGLLILNDPDTGEALAVMDATYLTAMRTGAGGGVAARYLAREDARTVGVFGSGAQAETQLMAACVVRPIEKARVLSRSKKNAEAFASKMGAQLGIEVEPVFEARHAVEGMDIVVTATTADTPLFDGAWLRPGQHVNAVGTHLPTAREIDTHAVARGKFFVDSRVACLIEAGEILLPIEEGAVTESHIVAEIGDVCAGLHPGRESEDEITIFKSVGVGHQDMTAARAAYDKAIKEGIGHEFRF